MIARSGQGDALLSGLGSSSSALLRCCSADIAKRTGKEVTLLVVSLAHTLPFWTSKSMVS